MLIQGFQFFKLISTTAVAYLDPGSGSFILQLILATLLGSMFVFRNTWKRFVNFLKKLISKENNDQEE